MQAIITLIILQVSTGSVLESLLQTGGTLAVLAFFLIYFMKEQKELRLKMDALTLRYEADLKDLRRVYDDKLDGVIRQQADNNSRMVTALHEVKVSNDKITEAVNYLTEKLDTK